MLKSFLASLPSEDDRRTFAAQCGTSLGHLRNCIYARKPIAPETCVLIERHSGQRVRRWHLRPPDWHRIWPELVGLPDAPIVAPEHQTVYSAVRPIGEGIPDAATPAAGRLSSHSEVRDAA